MPAPAAASTGFSPVRSLSRRSPGGIGAALLADTQGPGGAALGPERREHRDRGRQALEIRRARGANRLPGAAGQAPGSPDRGAGSGACPGGSGRLSRILSWQSAAASSATWASASSLLSGIPNWCVATAPSVDAYGSATAAITINGYHGAVPSRVSEVIVADLDVMGRAPRLMFHAGHG